MRKNLSSESLGFRGVTVIATSIATAVIQLSYLAVAISAFDGE
jgi:hypothetical protein